MIEITVKDRKYMQVRGRIYMLALVLVVLASAPQGLGFWLGLNRVSPKIKRDYTHLDSVLVQQWTADTQNSTSLVDVEEEKEEEEEEEDRERLIEPTWLDMFPRNPIISTNMVRDYPDFVNLKVDDPLWLDMPWPTEAGPEATAYRKHLQWKRKLSDGERKRWQQRAIYHRLMKKDSFYYCVDDYVYQSLLKEFNRLSDDANMNIGKKYNKIEAGLWRSIPLVLKQDEEAEVGAVMKAYYSAINRRNFDDIFTLWLPDSNVELVLPGYEKVRGNNDVEKSYRRLVKDSKPFGSIEASIMSVQAVGYVAIVHTMESIGPGSELKVARKKGSEEPSPNIKVTNSVIATTVLRKWNKQWRIMLHHAVKLNKEISNNNNNKPEKYRNREDVITASNTVGIRKEKGLPSNLPEELQNILKDYGSVLSSISRMKNDGSWEKVVMVDDDLTSNKQSQILENLLNKKFGDGNTDTDAADTNSGKKIRINKELINQFIDPSLKIGSKIDSNNPRVGPSIVGKGGMVIDNTASISKQTLQALRLLFDIGKITRQVKESLVMDMISCISKDETSLVEVAFELLVVQSNSYKLHSGNSVELLDEFADQVNVLAANTDIIDSSNYSSDDDDDDDDDDVQDDFTNGLLNTNKRH